MPPLTVISSNPTPTDPTALGRLATNIGLTVPPGTSAEQWASIGVSLRRAEQAVMWWIGDWWAYGDDAYGDRRAILDELARAGHNVPAYNTCRKAAAVARRFPHDRRRSLSFSHHEAVMGLSARDADWLLDRAETNGWSKAELRLEARHHKLQLLRRPGESAQQTQTVEDLHALAASGQQFGTIYADPPWPYENQSTRAATKNHYKEHNSLSVVEIGNLPVPTLAATAAHCHLWTTSSFLRDALDIMDSWGFAYKSSFVWVKPDFGIGNYWRLGHEFLLFGRRGKAPFLSNSEQSWIYERAGEHSAKPAKVRRIIEGTSPGPYLELFGRSEVEGWTVWGNEVAKRRQQPVDLFQ